MPRSNEWFARREPEAVALAGGTGTAENDSILMLCRVFRRYLCALAALGLLQSQHVSAIVLDWDTISWVEGTLTNSYQADPWDPDSGVSISVTQNNGAPLVPFSVAPNPMTPVINTGFQGGLPAAENALVVAINLANVSQSITVSLSFLASGGATDVSFRLFDIDAGGGSQDQLSQIYGLSIDGSTLIAPTITTSPDNTLVGSGLGQSVVGTAATSSTGLTSGRGNVLIDFGTNQIQSLTFTYGSTAAFLDPAYQHFAMHDINFTPVPEVNPTLLSIFSCLAAAGLVVRHRFTVRK